ncbi:macrolide transporter subunit MacA [uncultured Clostridium sp.]|jgi:HlyD family secretion protein|uniref:HlyD family efflux transporter periplasmic adaptor subunit n=1 Tax=Waltera sp. TaxID=2815806 RepID=UPI0008226344|nr:macrolide transporter subunit MacA [uncultured Clostridium sp.]
MKLKSPHFDKLKSLTKKQKKLILAGIALLLLILAACYTVFIAPLLQKEQWIYKEETVERGTLKVGVTESGSLEYNTKSIDYDLTLDVSDDDEDDSDDDDDTVQKYLKIEEIYAASGQRVTEGEELLKFTEDSVEAVRALLQNAVVEAQADYAEAESTYELSLLEAQTDYDTQKISASYAASIRNTSGTSVTNKVASLQVQLEQKQANAASLQEKLTEAQEDYQDALETYEAAKEGYEGAGTDNTVNFMTIQNGYLSARSKYQQAKSALTQAEDALSENESAITDLQNQLAAAQAKQKIDKLDTEETYQEAVITGQNAQTTYNAAVEDLKETLQEAEETKEKREEQLQAFEDFVGSDGILYATEDGVITEVSYEAGDRLTTTGALFSYATSDDMRISVDVTQEDIVDLQVGDAVDITFTAYPEDSYTGSILSINTTATSDYSNTVSYTVEISVEGELEQLYGGMTADVIFVTEEKEDVLYVSRKAIVEENGKTYVYRKTALGGRELAEVETGITNGVDIEILSGLEEGDTIYLASKVSSEAEVKSTEETADSGSSSDTAVGSDMELQEFDESLMPEDMQMPSGGAMPQGGPGGGNSGSFGGGMPRGPGGQ